MIIWMGGAVMCDRLRVINDSIYSMSVGVGCAGGHVMEVDGILIYM